MTKYLTPEAQAKFDHLTGVKASAECAIGAIMNDEASFMKPGNEWMGAEKECGGPVEPKLEPVERTHPHLSKTNVDNSFMVKRRMESLSEIRYEARKYKADDGMYAIVKCSQIAVAIAYDQEEAEAITNALAAAQTDA